VDLTPGYRDQTTPQQPHGRGRKKNEEKTYRCLYMTSHYDTKKLEKIL